MRPKIVAEEENCCLPPTYDEAVWWVIDDRIAVFDVGALF